MTMRQIIARKTLLGGGAVASLLLGWTGSGALHAQPSEAPNLPARTQTAPAKPRWFLRKNLIELPIELKDSARAQIQEIHLYMKDDPSAPWTARDKVGPHQRAFTVQAPRDGEYWFTMVTIDKQGKCYPSDVRNEPAGISVVIDPQPPQVEMTYLGNSPDGQLVQVEVSDINLD